MKKIIFICVSLFMMAGFMPAKEHQQAPEPEMACIWTSCLGTFCHEDYHDVEFAADVIEFIEDNICN